MGARPIIREVVAKRIYPLCRPNHSKPVAATFVVDRAPTFARVRSGNGPTKGGVAADQRAQGGRQQQLVGGPPIWSDLAVGGFATAGLHWCWAWRSRRKAAKACFLIPRL